MTKSNQVTMQLRRAMADVDTFIEVCSTIKLRDYQRGVAEAIFRSVQERAGRSFVVMFPRQSGKNELQAQLETYLLCCFYLMDAEMVKVSPTWKPQTLNAMRRLERVLDSNLIAKHLMDQGIRIHLPRRQIQDLFLLRTAPLEYRGRHGQRPSGSGRSPGHSPGQVRQGHVAPMAASTNATRVFWGTAWTSRTLLARELRAARKAEQKDGIQRVFVLTADDVSKEVPAYGDFVAGQIARLGRNHPMIKTQYFSEEIDAEGGLFPPARVALMRGGHLPQLAPRPGLLYAMTLDVAGEDEAIVC